MTKGQALAESVTTSIGSASYNGWKVNQTKELSSRNCNTNPASDLLNSPSGFGRRKRPSPTKSRVGQSLGVTRKRKRGSPFHPDEFWQYVDRRGANECWCWRDTVQERNGYGAFWHPERRRTLSAHRLAWELTHGDVGGLHVLHTCDNPRCCNVAHLYLGTPKQNAHDRVTRGRQANGWTGKRAS